MPDNNTSTGLPPEKAIKKKLLTNTSNFEKTNTTKQWIVIHNTAGGSTASGVWDTFQGGRQASCHYAVGDDGVLKMLEDGWKGYHTGKKPSSGSWLTNYNKSAKAADRGCNNSNSFGIEICDSYNPNTNNMPVNKEDAFKKRVNDAVELTRYLMKQHNIPIENVVRHLDISGKPCPGFMIGQDFNGAYKQVFPWDNFLNLVRTRNKNGDPIQIGSNTIDMGDGGGSTSPSGPPIDFDNREDWVNLSEVKGVVLSFMHPYHLFSVKRFEKEWEKEKYDRKFHFAVDSTGPTRKVETNLIAFSIQDNNKSTYINRALYQNKAVKNCISVGLFTSKSLTDYTKSETQLIRTCARVLHAFKLTPNDLWREFDLNRAPSPLLYLELDKWKAFLKQVDKQYSWLVDNVKLPDNSGESKPDDKVRKLTREIDESDKDDGDNGVIVPSPEELPKVDESKMPPVQNILTHEEFQRLLTLGDPKFVDEYAQKQEPYDKNLPEILEAEITENDRLQTLTQQYTSQQENLMNYSVGEASPGDGDHCKRASAELNAIWRSNSIKVEPIYPDLIIPPKHATSDKNLSDNNALPPGVLAGASVVEDYLESNADEFYDKQVSMFDYNKLDSLEDKKKTEGKPINYNDPYPYDDKITELEDHHPKVKIDEIESRLYDCNHIGCPIGQPMAKNFHMINDAMISQSKKTEARLVKIENTLSFLMRNLGRLGSRMNINCVYYGGQDSFGKYKTIRCLKDDRLEEGCSVTIDQCMACTRYEPILGQIYEILDATGLNGSYMMDDIKMSYMETHEYKNLNKIIPCNIEEYANLSINSSKKYESLITIWKSRDKEEYISKLKKQYKGEELDKKIKSIKEEDYMFKMDWDNTILETQEPDVKLYPKEGITAKYKVKPISDAPVEKASSTSNVNPRSILARTTPTDEDKENGGNVGAEEQEKEIVISSPTDVEDKKDKEQLESIKVGDWVDTRDEAETYEINKYSSEEFFFEGFGTNINMGATGSDGSVLPGMSGSEVRNKICEMARKIVQDHADKKAAYNNDPRTLKYENPKKYNDRRINTSEPVTGYDCSSLVSCCYHYAGLSAFVNGYTGSQFPQIKASAGGKCWVASIESAKDALPGDVIMWNDGASKGNPESGKPHHIAIYLGNNEYAHASGKTHPKRPDIRIDSLDRMKYTSGQPVFGRPKDLIEADKQASGGGEIKETIKNKSGEQLNTIYKFSKAVVTHYNDGGRYSSGVVANAAAKKYCASHNMPYGTKLYFPELDGKCGENNKGIFYVEDSGGPFFDFDLHVPSSFGSANIGKKNMDVYVLEWGKKAVAIPMIYWLEKYTGGQWNSYKGGWRTYKNMNGQIINFHKFKANLKNFNPPGYVEGTHWDKNISKHPRF